MSADVPQALREFVSRIDAADPTAPVTVQLAVGDQRFALREPVAKALVEALRSYHDPRDNGTCAHCGGRLDTGFTCTSCGIVNGIFGKTLTDVVLRNDRALES